MAIITWDTAYGRSIMIEPFYNYLKKIGVDLVGKEVFGIRDVDLTTQLMKLRRSKADFLMTSTIAGGPVAIKRGCKEMGWDVPLLNAAGTDEGTIRLAPQLFEGDIVGRPQKSFHETEDPSIRKVLK